MALRTQTIRHLCTFSTTEEMLKNFLILAAKRQKKEVVITNTNKIADMIKRKFPPIHPDKFPPVIENSERG